MARFFERYTCPDMVVSRAADCKRALETRLGLPEGPPLRPMMYENGFEVTYLQVHPDDGLSASSLQLIGTTPLASDESKDERGRLLRKMLLAYITHQRQDRPLVTHVQPLATPTQEDVDTIIETLRSKGVPFVALLNNVYIGLVEADDGRMHYDPIADAGTYLEFAASVQRDYPGFVLPPELSDDSETADLEPGTLVRPVARTHLTANVEAIIERYRWMLDWPEDGDMELVDGDGERSIVLRPMNKLSATWEFVQPTRPDGRAGQWLDRFGEGPMANRLGVYGLDAKLEDLDRRGTGWAEIAPGPNGERRVAVRRYDVHGLPFELEEMSVVPRGIGQGRVA